jgi:hypothetical protein
MNTRLWYLASALTLGLLALLTVWGTWGSGPPAAQAQSGSIHYVAPTGADTGGCADPAHPCATVQYAVDQAAAGDEVHIATGIYTDVHPRAGLTQTVYISKTVTLRGGYDVAFTEPPDPATYPTTLDAQGRGRVLYITGAISPTVEGLRITGGNAAGLGGVSWGWGDAGGGVYVLTATVILRHNQVFSNTTRYYGGGLYLNENTTTLSGNAVFSNTAMFGGGLYLRNSTATLNGNVVATNTATYYGGGLCLYSITATVSGNIITANMARHGGGLVVGAGHIVLNGNTIAANTAHATGGPPWPASAATSGDEPSPPADPRPRGGGLYLGGSTATLNGNTIVANLAEEGGGLCLHYSYDTLTNNVIVDNRASVAGNGVYIEGARPALQHNTIVHNHDGEGSGLYVTGYVLYPPWLGTVYSTVMLTNTILISHPVDISVTAGNTVTVNGVLWYDTPITISQAATAIVTVQHQRWGDPAFADPATGDYHLGPGSAAINAGVNAGVTTDMDGDARPDWCFPDLGADEFITGQGCRYFYLPLVWRPGA